MEADRRRRIKDGKEFDHLFPSPSEQDKTIKKEGNVEDTMSLIQQTVPLTLWHTEKIARVLKGKTLEETCRNIWHFVYNHIQYKRDKDGVEQVRSPRRTWWERKSGVDCDCYTEFISSILLNLNIPHKARITKYPKEFPQVPRWQHVYPIVPRKGRWLKRMDDRDDYIVIDCVKDDFDDEQPFLECKDYDMRLDYLDGIDEQGIQRENRGYMDYGSEPEPDNVDLADLASVYDDEEMGNIFKKIGSAAKKVASNVKTATKVVANQVKETAQKVGDKVGDGVRFINRYINPATLLLRNGSLLAMKVNLMNVGGRLRYAYLSDEQAQKLGMNLNELNKLRAVKDRAETVYWQAGGKKSNLKKAILGGKGNRDKKVPLSGFDGIGAIDNVYADYDEYNIIHQDNIEGLGELASGTAIAAASSAVAAISAALKQIKGLFASGGSEEQFFQSETDNAGNESTAPATIPEDEDAFTYEDASASSASPPVTQVQTQTSISQSTVNPTYETKVNTPAPTANQSVLPDQYTASRRAPATTEVATQTTALQTQDNTQKQDGFFKKTSEWVKANPGKSLLVAGGVIAGGFLIKKAFSGGSGTSGLDGLPYRRKKKSRKRKHKGHKNAGNRRQRSKVKRQILL